MGAKFAWEPRVFQISQFDPVQEFRLESYVTEDLIIDLPGTYAIVVEKVFKCFTRCWS